MSKEQQQEVEVVACDDVLFDLVRFTDSSFFRDEVDDFISNHINAFVTTLDNMKLKHDADHKIVNSKDHRGCSKDDANECFQSSNVDELMRHMDDLPHSYNLMFEQYQRRIDNLFDEFSKRHRVSSSVVYACFRDAVDGKFTALFEEHEYKWFADKVLSWMDFDEFLRLMFRAAAALGHDKGHPTGAPSRAESKG